MTTRDPEFLVVPHIDIQGRAWCEIHAKVVQTRAASPADIAGVRLFLFPSSLLTRNV